MASRTRASLAKRSDGKSKMIRIRSLGENDFDAVHAVINQAAQAYRGVIPADRWKEPYMPARELAAEIAAGVVFCGAEEGARLHGVMGIQDRGEVALIRHAYVLPARQRAGIGSALLRHVLGSTRKPVLIGTWAAASWAVAFYRRNGFVQLSDDDKDALLRRYWSIPARQIATSVVLADRRWQERAAGAPR